MATWFRRAAVVALLFAARPAAANLITNGSFETGDFTGWRQLANTSESGVAGTFMGVAPPDGSFQAYFGQNTAGYIRQTAQLPTVAGQKYTVTFKLANLGDGSNTFRVKFEDTYVYELLNVAAFSYKTVSLVVTAPDSRSLLAFITKNVNSYFLVDDVRVDKGITAVPEPSSFALAGAGVLSLGLCVVRRRKGGSRAV